MMAAEKWYEYQANYQKYGFDMQPRPIPAAKEKPAKKTELCASDKLHILELLLLVGLLCIGMVITTAYGAKAQYNINQIKAECDSLQGEIQNLDVAIKSAVSIESVERKAVEELEMIYPSSADIAYVDCGSQETEKFSLALKENAYPVN